MGFEEFKKANPWFERLINERIELGKNIDKLQAYMETEAFEALSTHNKDLLTLQSSTMVTLYGILVLRANLITEENKLTTSEG